MSHLRSGTPDLNDLAEYPDFKSLVKETDQTYGEAGLVTAVKRGNIKVAEALLKLGADIRIKDDDAGENSIGLSMLNRQYGILEAILKTRSNEISSEERKTYLKEAFEYRDVKLVDLILKYLFPQNLNSEEFLKAGPTEIASLLIKHICQKDKGQSKIYYAAKYGRMDVLESADFLMSAG